MRKGMLIIISGPSGAGKGTLIEKLRKEDDGLAFSVSVTTRAPRPTETNGVEYHFITGEEFARMETAGLLLETATVHGHSYGTPREPIERLPGEGRDIILDIDTQGAASMMKLYPDCVSVFILPPTMRALSERLNKRATETGAEYEKRLRNAQGEIALMPRYQYAIINDDLNDALCKLRAVIAAERLKTCRYMPEIQ